MATETTHLRPLTYDDLKEMPQDGNRYEIIDGEPVVSPVPSLIHAEIVARLLVLIRELVLKHHPGGRVLTAQVDVRLSPLRIVEPDNVYVGAERRRIMADPALIEGAPDLVVEVLSPSNRAYDEQVKHRVYAQIGVREYWLADGERRSLTIFALEEGAFRRLPNAGGVARSRLLPVLTADVPALFTDLL